MCRLLGIKGFDAARHHEVIEAFFGLATGGMVLEGDSAGHLDGWGLAYYEQGAARIIKSGASLVAERGRFFDAVKAIGETPVLIVHLRKSAWKGTTAERHAHPFEHRGLVLAHNGTIRDYASLLPELQKENLPAGDALDTEVYLRYVANYNEGSTEKSFLAAVHRIREKNTYTSLNALLSDGSNLCAYRDYTKYPDYYSFFHARVNGAEVVSSEQLLPAVTWHSMENGALLTF